MAVSSEFIAAQLQRVLDELQQVRRELAEVERELGEVHADRVQIGDETTVLTGTVLRYSSEHIARGGVQRRLQRLEERIARLEQARPAPG